MTKKKIKTYNRLFRKPSADFEVNTKKSLTIPGMDDSLQQMLDNHSIDPLEETFENYFGDNEEYDEIMKMDLLDKLVYASNIREEVQQKLADIRQKQLDAQNASIVEDAQESTQENSEDE